MMSWYVKGGSNYATGSQANIWAAMVKSGIPTGSYFDNGFRDISYGGYVQVDDPYWKLGGVSAESKAEVGLYNSNLITIDSTGIQIGGGTKVLDVKDEDDMASNSANSLATQQSIKAYHDLRSDIVATTHTWSSDLTETLQGWRGTHNSTFTLYFTFDVPETRSDWRFSLVSYSLVDNPGGDSAQWTAGYNRAGQTYSYNNIFNAVNDPISQATAYVIYRHTTSLFSANKGDVIVGKVYKYANTGIGSYFYWMTLNLNHVF